MNQGKNTKATKKMDTEMAMANFIIIMAASMTDNGLTIR
jgi:hypothetical protein